MEYYIYINTDGLPFAINTRDRDDIDSVLIDIDDYFMHAICENGINKYKFNADKTSLILNVDKINEEGLQEIVLRFNIYKSKLLSKFKNLKIDVGAGIEPPLTTEELKWYSDLITFDKSITINTTEEDYPITPSRLL